MWVGNPANCPVEPDYVLKEPLSLLSVTDEMLNSAKEIGEDAMYQWTFTCNQISVLFSKKKKLLKIKSPSKK